MCTLVRRWSCRGGVSVLVARARGAAVLAAAHTPLCTLCDCERLTGERVKRACTWPHRSKRAPHVPTQGLLLRRPKRCRKSGCLPYLRRAVAPAATCLQACAPRRAAPGLSAHRNGRRGQPSAAERLAISRCAPPSQRCVKRWRRPREAQDCTRVVLSRRACARPRSRARRMRTPAGELAQLPAVQVALKHHERCGGAAHRV